MIRSILSELPIEYSSVFLRADANIPIANGIIQSDFRLHALKPTLDLLIKKKAIVVFATHIGRPKKHEPALSTKQLIPWFIEQGYDARFAPTLQEAHNLITENKPLIIVLENLRFFEGEKTGSHTFAKKLAQLTEFYVDDAFAALHRKDTSIYLLPQLFAPKKRTIGLLVEKEIKCLDVLLHKPRKGYTLILGGGKVSTKIPLINAFIQKVETIILCPAIVFTFLKAQGKAVGDSLVDENEINTCLSIIELAQKYNTKIVYPIDYQVARTSFNGRLLYTNDNFIPEQTVGIAAGQRSITLFASIIMKSNTIFYNGAMGIAKRPETLETAQELFAAIAASKGYSVIAGGDSVALIERTGLANQIGYLSTGGGATLTFLSGKPLPGLTVLSE